MFEENLIIKGKKTLSKDIYQMTLVAKTDCIKNPGQFINIKVDGFYLRRPISICDYDDAGNMRIVFKVVGEGTDVLSKIPEGHSVSCLYPLGNGFDVDVLSKNDNPVLIGGGIGVPPLVGLCRELIKCGFLPTVYLGFNSINDAILIDNFESMGVSPKVATLDGSLGIKGFVTTLLKSNLGNYIFSCGPIPMLKAVHCMASRGQYSLEARMGCGFGACMGCSTKTTNGYKRICKDGPVLRQEEIQWED